MVAQRLVEGMVDYLKIRGASCRCIDYRYDQLHSSVGKRQWYIDMRAAHSQAVVRQWFESSVAFLTNGSVPQVTMRKVRVHGVCRVAARKLVCGHAGDFRHALPLGFGRR